jgi:hypothetical protein
MSWRFRINMMLSAMSQASNGNSFRAYFILDGNLIKRPATMKTPRPQW